MASLLVAAVLVLMAVLAGLFAWSRTSPYPSAMLIRHAFEKGGAATNLVLEKHAPKDIDSVAGIQYRAGDPDAYLDVYYARQDRASVPTIVWIHGGGWLAGNKDDLSPWARILAGKGFNVVALNYSLAPEKRYPLPTVQANAALRYLEGHAVRLGIDPRKLILAGDSAGAQIAAQAALIETSPGYAGRIGIPPGLARGRIAALLLNCGPYDLGLVDPEGATDGAKLVRTFLWSYTGRKDFQAMEGIDLVSIPGHVTADFPPSFVTAGNLDPLLPHSQALVAALDRAGVVNDALFFPDAYTPGLNHEYQFDLDTREGMQALERMVAFSREHASVP